MINNVSFLNFKSNLQSIKQNVNPFLKQNPIAPKLAPLQYDVISFSGSKSLNKNLFDALKNKDACQKVHDDANAAEKDLKNLLERALKDLISNKKTPDKPIDAITTRVKSPYSIREKVASEFEHRITETNQVFNPVNSDEIKKIIGDIVGARITLRSNDSNETSKIINALIEEVKAGRLKIIRIENYEPENLDEKYRYFKHEDLERLRKAAEKANGKKIEFKNEPKKTGYMALHIDVDLSNRAKYPEDNNGYGGEIQIIGTDVQKLKEVEDACYKLQQDKTIKAAHHAYDAFSSYFLKYYHDTKTYPNVEEKFTQYTAKAYQAQREKSPIVSTFKKNKQTPFYKNGTIYNRSTEFLTIKKAGMEKDLPPELDFNNLADIKHFSDALFLLTQSAK